MKTPKTVPTATATLSWVALLRENLPRHAARGGADTISSLAARLEASTQAAAVSRADALEPMIGLAASVAHELSVTEARATEQLTMLQAQTEPAGKAQAISSVLAADWPSTASDDVRALKRWMDSDALGDRYALALHRLQQQIEFLLLATARLATTLRDDRTWHAFPGPVEQTVCRLGRSLLEQTHQRWPLRCAAIGVLALVAPGDTTAAGEARQSLLHHTSRHQDDSWVQGSALEAMTECNAQRGREVDALLRFVMLPEERILTNSETRDHRFVRARAAELAGRHGRVGLITEMLERPDPSEHVRIQAVRALGSIGTRDALATVEAVIAPSLQRLPDPSAKVRAAAAISVLPGAATPPSADWVDVFQLALLREADEWAIGVICQAVLDRRHELALHHASSLARCLEAWTPALLHWRDEGESKDIAITSAHLLDWLSVQASDAERETYTAIEAWLLSSSEGEEKVFDTGAVASLSPDRLLSVLTLLAADHLDLSAKPLRKGFRIFHGVRPGFSLWRLAHELSNPSPDKRQAFSHLTDRVPRGSLIAPSTRMAEVTKTRVPGQRVASPTGLYWGQELPLPSLLLAAARHGQVQVGTPLTQMSIRAMGGGPVGAGLKAQRHYVRLAKRREELLRSGASDARERYSEDTRAAGFKIGHDEERAPLSTPAGAPGAAGAGSVAAIAAIPDLQALLVEAARTDTNTVVQLGAVAGGLLAAWGARTWIGYRQLAHWRRKVPLVIGGWGSRGKSGTERIKAALFHGMGYRVACKTTGCEAMMIASVPGVKPEEIFVYRPDDKATIWEQRDMLRLGAKLEAQVFLWECMALNPDFVSTLQHEWMRDDIATITNTYPDHEDIQGPTGHDVAEVIARFIPANAEVVTSEQHMTPVLRGKSREQNSKLHVCRAEEWELLADDLLERFPYAEHPRNIALVAQLAEQLEMPRDTAIKAMADHVVPDLGVLKEYGPITYRERRLSFVNGMSANDRAGFMSNWSRMALDEWGTESGLTHRALILVNNRADRPARSQVFVELLLQDVAADGICVVGSDVRAFARSYKRGLDALIRPALRKLAQGEHGRARLAEELARRLRRCAADEEAAVAAVMRFAPEASVEGVRKTAQGLYVSQPGAFAQARPAMTDEAPKKEALEQWLREVSWLWLLQSTWDWDVEKAIDAFVDILQSRVQTVDDPSATDEQVLAIMLRSAPPGCSTRILGCSNIKGVGIAIVNRWQSIHGAVGRLAALPTADAAGVAEILEAFSGSLGAVEAALVIEALEEQLRVGRFGIVGLSAAAQALLQHARESERAALEESQESRSAGTARLRGWLDSHLDALHGIRRTRSASRLYEDLINRRVSMARASLVAQAIVRAQSGA